MYFYVTPNIGGMTTKRALVVPQHTPMYLKKKVEQRALFNFFIFHPTFPSPPPPSATKTNTDMPEWKYHHRPGMMGRGVQVQNAIPVSDSY